jgi:hypothetical protein
LGVIVTLRLPSRKKLIFVGAMAAVTILGGLMASYDYYRAERMAFDGKVVNIEWKSQNHGMPLVTLRTTVGLESVQHYRLLIDPRLKVGDNFSKAAGSRDCTVNGEARQCVR